MANKECIKENKKTLGVIRWDAWYGHDGDPKSVISAVERTLSPPEFHFRAPFFAKVTEDNKIIIPEYTQEIFDKEMEYAIEAGIDYFVYMFYADDMKKAREMHLKSKYKNDVKFAFFTHGFTEERVPEYIKYFKEDFYMTVQGGRPIIYYFTGFELAKKCIEMLKDACKKEGIPEPFSVVCNIGTEDTINSGGDAKGQYAVPGSKGMSFSSVRKEAQKLWQSFKETGMQYVPTVSSGYNTLPRVKNPVFWMACGQDGWAEYATAKDIEEHLQEAYDHLDENNGQTNLNTLLMYAWNEHDEGGWICPTIAVDEEGRQIFDKNGNPLINRERIDAVKKVTSKIKCEKHF